MKASKPRVAKDKKLSDRTSRRSTIDRPVSQAVVFKHGLRAGTLAREAGSTVFRYDQAYLQGDHPPVAYTLPCTAEPVVVSAGAVPPFFAGLLPEGRRLASLRQQVKTSADDELSLLVAVGADPVGDVQILPANAKGDATLPSDDEHADLLAPEVQAADFSTVDFSELAAAGGLVDSSALAGVQDKVSGRMITLPLQHSGRVHLLKLNPPEYPNVVENEAYFLTLAKKLKQPAATAKLVYDCQGRAGLLVDRFDRKLVERTQGTYHLERLGMEDASQLLGVYPADKYAVATEDVGKAIMDVCPAALPAARSILEQVVFAWLTGNGDLHAKNMSVLCTDDEWRVSPIYDVPSTLLYDDSTMALPVAGKVKGLSRRAFLAFAASLELPEAVAVRVIDHVLTVTEPVAQELTDGRVSIDPRQLRDVRRVLAARRRGMG